MSHGLRIFHPMIARRVNAWRSAWAAPLKICFVRHLRGSGVLPAWLEANFDRRTHREPHRCRGRVRVEYIIVLPYMVMTADATAAPAADTGTVISHAMTIARTVLH